MNTDIKLFVTEIQRFCMHDGPGVRTTVFLKGCPLNCAWCHNPETKKSGAELLFYANKCIYCRACEENCKNNAHSFDENHLILRDKCTLCGACANICPTRAVEICGNEYTVEEITSTVQRDSAFYINGGGITLSGGEPLMQGDGAIALLSACKSHGISTVVETSGYIDESILSSAIDLVDLFLWDIKDTDEKRHKQYTGVSNKKILDNLFFADKKGAKTKLRCILVNGVNTDVEHYQGIAKIASQLSNCEGVELLPYHAYAGTKATFLGGEDNGKTGWIPTLEQIEAAKEILRCENIKVY